MTSPEIGPEVLYEKCADCHLFVEPNDVEPIEGMTFADYIHLHRGDDADNALDESHEAKPSGMLANLNTWKAYGPPEMKERFVKEYQVWVYKNPRWSQEPPHDPLIFTTERLDRLELYSQGVDATSPEEACQKVKTEHEYQAKFIRMDEEIRTWNIR